MSKLDELIRELCPDGVEYRKLSTISDIVRGNRITKKNLIENGKYPVMSGGTSFLGRYDKYNRSENTITIAQYGSAGYVSFVAEKFWANDVCYSIFPKSEIVNKYLYHVLTNKQLEIYSLTTKAIPDCLPKDRLEEILIPVPPLEIQEEIVKILDKFTDYVTELQAELQARKQQFEYYRDKLISNQIDVKYRKLNEIFDFKNGLSKGKEFFGKGVPFIRYTDVYNKRALRKGDITALVECTSDELSKLKVSRGDVFFTRTSETAEDVGWSSVMLDEMEDCVFNGFTIKATPKTEDLLPEYCVYCFSTRDFRSYVAKKCSFTTRASLTGKSIGEYLMAIPSLDIQKKIVDVLDNFETVCNDLNIGLPAEIEKRQKQYEYYRDALLTFAETGMVVATRLDSTRLDSTRPY